MLIFLFGCRYIQLNLPTKVTRNLLGIRHGDDGIHAVNSRIQGFFNVNVIISPDAVALIRPGIDRLAAAQGSIDGRQPLLAI